MRYEVHGWPNCQVWKVYDSFLEEVMCEYDNFEDAQSCAARFNWINKTFIEALDRL